MTLIVQSRYIYNLILCVCRRVYMCVYFYIYSHSNTPTLHFPLQSLVINQSQAGTLAPVAKKQTAHGRAGLYLLQLLPPTQAPFLMAS